MVKKRGASARSKASMEGAQASEASEAGGSKAAGQAQAKSVRVEIGEDFVTVHGHGDEELSLDGWTLTESGVDSAGTPVPGVTYMFAGDFKLNTPDAYDSYAVHNNGQLRVWGSQDDKECFSFELAAGQRWGQVPGLITVKLMDGTGKEQAKGVSKPSTEPVADTQGQDTAASQKTTQTNPSTEPETAGGASTGLEQVEEDEAQTEEQVEDTTSAGPVEDSQNTVVAQKATKNKSGVVLVVGPNYVALTNNGHHDVQLKGWRLREGKDADDGRVEPGVTYKFIMDRYLRCNKSLAIVNNGADLYVREIPHCEAIQMGSRWGSEYGTVAVALDDKQGNLVATWPQMGAAWETANLTQTNPSDEPKDVVMEQGEGESASNTRAGDDVSTTQAGRMGMEEEEADDDQTAATTRVNDGASTSQASAAPPTRVNEGASTSQAANGGLRLEADQSGNADYVCVVNYGAEKVALRGHILQDARHDIIYEFKNHVVGPQQRIKVITRRSDLTASSERGGDSKSKIYRSPFRIKPCLIFLRLLRTDAPIAETLVPGPMQQAGAGPSDQLGSSAEKPNETETESPESPSPTTQTPMPSASPSPAKPKTPLGSPHESSASPSPARLRKRGASPSLGEPKRSRAASEGTFGNLPVRHRQPLPTKEQQALVASGAESQDSMGDDMADLNIDEEEDVALTIDEEIEAVLFTAKSSDDLANYTVLVQSEAGRCWFRQLETPKECWDDNKLGSFDTAASITAQLFKGERQMLQVRRGDLPFGHWEPAVRKGLVYIPTQVHEAFYKPYITADRKNPTTTVGFYYMAQAMFDQQQAVQAIQWSAGATCSVGGGQLELSYAKDIGSLVLSAVGTVDLSGCKIAFKLRVDGQAKQYDFSLDRNFLMPDDAREVWPPEVAEPNDFDTVTAQLFDRAGRQLAAVKRGGDVFDPAMWIADIPTIYGFVQLSGKEWIGLRQGLNRSRPAWVGLNIELIDGIVGRFEEEGAVYPTPATGQNLVATPAPQPPQTAPIGQNLVAVPGTFARVEHADEFGASTAVNYFCQETMTPGTVVPANVVVYKVAPVWSISRNSKAFPICLYRGTWWERKNFTSKDGLVKYQCVHSCRAPDALANTTINIDPRSNIVLNHDAALYHNPAVQHRAG